LKLIIAHLLFGSKKYFAILLIPLSLLFELVITLSVVMCFETDLRSLVMPDFTLILTRILKFANLYCVSIRSKTQHREILVIWVICYLFRVIIFFLNLIDNYTFIFNHYVLSY